MKLRPCEECGRHVRGDAQTCPFCGAASSDRIGGKAPAIAIAACVGVALSVCGCYGPPPHARGMEPEAPPMAQPQPLEQQSAEATPAASQKYAQPPASDVAR
jgi:hypothetical protein